MQTVMLLFFGLLLSLTSLAADKSWSFNYEVTVPAIAAGKGPVEVFVPVAVTDENQTISNFSVQSDNTALADGKLEKEATYGNSFWHATVPHTNGKPTILTFTYDIIRKENKKSDLAKARQTFLTPEEKKSFALFLKANKRVPVDGDLVTKIRKELPASAATPLTKARAIYDYVFANMEYKKVGTGWGNGDTYWACSQKYGNCTDFHALFTSLARAEGIPARFEIGFPIPTDKQKGQIKGYHCWVNFWLPDSGWIPVDVSEAKKDPSKKELYFGTHPADRIKFTVGRDLVLTPDQSFKPLNYFVFPVVTVAGMQLEKVETKFSFE